MDDLIRLDLTAETLREEKVFSFKDCRSICSRLNSLLLLESSGTLYWNEMKCKLPSSGGSFDWVTLENTHRYILAHGIQTIKLGVTSFDDRDILGKSMLASR